MHGSLATKLRVLRAERGLTVRQVAEISGVAKETVSQIERGERHPYDRTLAKLAQAYDVPVEELLEAEESVPLGEAPQESGLEGWIEKVLEEDDFAREFERAKTSQELADKFHRAKFEASVEQQEMVKALKNEHAAAGAILEARRDYEMRKAQETAAGLLANMRGVGRDVSALSPRELVAGALRTQRDLRDLRGLFEQPPSARREDLREAGA